MEIQWYPGHMAKASKMLRSNLKAVEVVIEVLDARIPRSSRNPDFAEMLESRSRVVVLNKADLADPQATARWLAVLRSQGLACTALNAQTGEGASELIRLASEAAKESKARAQAKGINPGAVRAMVVGVPNVGKSSVINRLSGRATARTGNRPGITRGKQWISVKGKFDLLDTPGILWPKFDDPEVGLKLALTGAIDDDILDLPELAVRGLRLLWQIIPGALSARYGLPSEGAEPHEMLLSIGRRRGLLGPGGAVDVERAAKAFLTDLRTGRIGRMTLDVPDLREEEFGR